MRPVVLSHGVRIAAVLVVALAATAWSKDPIAPDLAERIATASPGASLRVIVRFSGKMNAATPFAGARRDRNRQLLQELRAAANRARVPFDRFAQSRAIERIVPLWIVNGVALTASPAVIRDLDGQPWIESIRLDGVVPEPKMERAAAAAPEWNVAMVRAPEIWAQGFDGTGVVVGIMDSGVDPLHTDLASRYRGGSNSWFDPNGVYVSPTDTSGHGTMVAGLAVGGDAGGTAVGVAPGAQWIAVKIFDDSGEASFGNIHQGFQWMLDPDSNPATDDAPRVVNNSWGLTDRLGQYDAEFRDDVQLLAAAGVAVVCAAGNDGPAASTSLSPANYPECVAVGAVNDSEMVGLFSARGPSAFDAGIYPSLVAPGVSVRSCDLTFGGVLPLSYATDSGTSFAAAHVSGAIALLTQAFPHAGCARIQDAIIDSARDLGPAGSDNAYGHGLIDLAQAYAALAPNRAPIVEDLPDVVFR